MRISVWYGRAADGASAPLAPGKRYDLGAQLAFARRRRQQLSNYGEAQMRPPLMDRVLRAAAMTTWREAVAAA